MPYIWRHGFKIRLTKPIWIFPPPDYVVIYRLIRVYRFLDRIKKSQMIAWQGETWDSELGPINVCRPEEEVEFLTLLKTNEAKQSVSSFNVYVSDYTRDATLPADIFLSKRFIKPNA